MILDADTESLIPNSSLSTHILQNHTLSNDDYRVSFTLRLAHIGDYQQAKAVILQANGAASARA